MNNQFLMNKAVTVQYAFKKDGKGERHGTPAERLLAAQARKNNALPVGARPPPAPLTLGGFGMGIPGAPGGTPGAMPGMGGIPPPPQMGYPGMSGGVYQGGQFAGVLAQQGPPSGGLVPPPPPMGFTPQQTMMGVPPPPPAFGAPPGGGGGGMMFTPQRPPGPPMGIQPPPGFQPGPGGQGMMMAPPPPSPAFLTGPNAS
jgi:splicing factor 3B subunit 4